MVVGLFLVVMLWFGDFVVLFVVWVVCWMDLVVVVGFCLLFMCLVMSLVDR